MSAKLIFFIPAVLALMHGTSDALECYHCYSNGRVHSKDGQFVPCNEANLTLSNTWICPGINSRCIYEIVEIESTKDQQIWRTCSNGIFDPCDPNAVPPGVKMLKCSHCGKDRCNLKWIENEKENNNTFTFNINVNANINIRQLF